MKRVLLCLVIGLVMAVLSLSAQAQYDYGMDYRFQSTSTMQGSGSVYASVAVTGGATTTYDETSATHARGRTAARTTIDSHPGEPMPVGEGWVMLVLAAGAGGAIVLRRRKRKKVTNP